MRAFETCYTSVSRGDLGEALNLLKRELVSYRWFPLVSRVHPVNRSRDLSF